MIKIVNGVFGFKKDGFIIPKTSKDEPFDAGAELEKRLVAQGVAKYVVETETVAEVEEETEAVVEAEVDEAKELDKEALIARYKELGLGGNPANWKAETILKKIEEAEAALAEEAPDLNSDDGVVE